MLVVAVTKPNAHATGFANVPRISPRRSRRRAFAEAGARERL
jgi:hypothetical protein